MDAGGRSGCTGSRWGENYINPRRWNARNVPLKVSPAPRAERGWGMRVRVPLQRALQKVGEEPECAQALLLVRAAMTFVAQLGILEVAAFLLACRE
jgi:hypothetical protein